MNKFNFIYNLFFLLFFSLELTAQNNIGQFPISNYEKVDYNAGTQNWDIKQDKKGLIYIANNDGLLIYNGNDWKLNKLPKQTICRSVFVLDSMVFVGGQGELGFFVPNKQGKLVFTSLPNIENYDISKIGGIWKILRQKNQIIFFALEGVITFDIISKSIQVIDTYAPYLNIHGLDNKVIIHSLEKGLLEFDDNHLSPISWLNFFSKMNVNSILTYGKKVLVSTSNNGLFILRDSTITEFNTNVKSFLTTNTVYKTEILEEGKIACATSQGGLLIIDSTGIAMQLIDKNSGLQNNNILSICKDNSNNLWLGLDFGIDYIETNTNYKTIFADAHLEGTSYAVTIYENELFIGTNNGLYSVDWLKYTNPVDQLQFRNPYNIKGQVWGLNSVHNNLFLSHHNGLYHLTKNKSKRVGSSKGSWMIQTLESDDRYVIEGTYTGVNIYKWNNESLTFHSTLKNFNESSRFIEQDSEENIWIAHPYKGVFRCVLNSDKTEFKEIVKYDQSKGFPSQNRLKVFKINKQLVFTTEDGIYKYDSETDRMIKEIELNEILGKNTNCIYFKEGSNGNVWFVDESENVGKISFFTNGFKQSYKVQYYPEIRDKLVNGLEFIYPLTDNQIFFGAEKGTIFYSEEEKINGNKHRVLIDKVKLNGEFDSIINYNFITQNDKMELNSNQSNISFTYSIPIYNSAYTPKFSNKLEGFDQTWTPWNSTHKREFTNLAPGNYSFLVKALNNESKETLVTSYNFRIQPPWYSTVFAYSSYSLITLLGLSFLFFYPRQKYKKEKKYLEKVQEKRLQEKDIIHRQEVAYSEKMIMQLKNEKLQGEVDYKNKELASSTMHLVQKTEILNKIKNDIEKAYSSKSDRKFVNSQLKSIITLINDNVRLDKNWGQFENHFDKVHVDFNKRLKLKYAQLTPNDLKLCAYLRMNLTTKEIAPLLNISVRGVEISRYRLRKKLELDREENLYEFIASI